MTVAELVKSYKLKDAVNPNLALGREKTYLLMQKSGQLPTDKPYSDENYAELVDLKYMNLPSQETANSYLTNIFNKIAKILPQLMTGNRDDLYSKGLLPPLGAGDTLELQYDQIGTTTGYQRNAFNPTQMTGGDLVFSQRIRLSTIQGDTNPDKITSSVVWPDLEIPQAIIPSITVGLSGGFPDMFLNILKRTWEKWRFERFRKQISMAAQTPSSDEWFNSDNTWTRNEASFKVLPVKLTNADTLQQILEFVYDTAATLEGEYSKDYNAAQIEQISKMNQMSIYFDKSVKAKWKTTNAVLFNGKAIDFKTVFKNVEFFKMLDPITVPDDYGAPFAVMFNDLPGRHPFVHQPFTNGIRRGIQMWERNQGIGIFDHYWDASGNNNSINMIVFYQPK